MVYLGLIGEALATEKVYIMPISTDLSSRPASTIGPYYARYRKKLLPYYLQKAYMGLQFTEEICQTFYKHARMEIEHHADIRDALNKRPLQRQPTAAPFDLLRRLRLRLSFEDYHKMQSRAERYIRRRVLRRTTMPRKWTGSPTAPNSNKWGDWN
jgi:hypothetical protein